MTNPQPSKSKLKGRFVINVVGNRLTQDIDGMVTNYGYDDANRLLTVNNVDYGWDDNGNLLNDGVNTYVYDQANRLISVNGQTTFGYNGLGDRLRQTVNGVTTTYANDYAAGLTQVLSDGTSAYLYGVGRVGQYDNTMQYFGADGLGSVRQIYNGAGIVQMNGRYDPFGNVMSANGNATSVYGFTGEQTDATGLVYLRARYYEPGEGRFTTRDTWQGDYQQPLSLNRWNYVQSNPVNFVDPSGFDPGFGRDWAGPVIASLCFDLHTGTQGVWFSSSQTGLFGGVTAKQAVTLCQKAYLKEYWSKDLYGFQLGDQLPQTATELFGWYVYNHRGKFGDTDRLYFDGKQSLTQELSMSGSVAGLRTMFYRQGNIGDPTLLRFNEGEFIGSLLNDTGISSGLSIPLTFFMGSYWYQVRAIQTSEGKRVGFRIDNDTTLASGTHVRGRFPDQYDQDLETLIEVDPSLGDKPLGAILADTANYQVISILRSRSRSDAPGGGANLYQTYTWTEKWDDCWLQLRPEEQLTKRLFAPSLLDVQVWQDFRQYTTDPEGYPAN